MINSCAHLTDSFQLHSLGFLKVLWEFGRRRATSMIITIPSGSAQTDSGRRKSRSVNLGFSTSLCVLFCLLNFHLSSCPDIFHFQQWFGILHPSRMLCHLISVSEHFDPILLSQCFKHVLLYTTE